MSILAKFLKREPDLCEKDLVKPYRHKAREALLREDLPKAIAYLECGIRLAPGALDLYLQRAQILQYGLNNCAGALKDYRYILRKLESQPDEPLADKCRQAMRDMFSHTTT